MIVGSAAPSVGDADPRSDAPPAPGELAADLTVAAADAAAPRPGRDGGATPAAPGTISAHLDARESPAARSSSPPGDFRGALRRAHWGAASPESAPPSAVATSAEQLGARAAANAVASTVTLDSSWHPADLATWATSRAPAQAPASHEDLAAPDAASADGDAQTLAADATVAWAAEDTAMAGAAGANAASILAHPAAIAATAAAAAWLQPVGESPELAAPPPSTATADEIRGATVDGHRTAEGHDSEAEPPGERGPTATTTAVGAPVTITGFATASSAGANAARAEPAVAASTTAAPAMLTSSLVVAEALAAVPSAAKSLAASVSAEPDTRARSGPRSTTHTSRAITPTQARDAALPLEASSPAFRAPGTSEASGAAGDRPDSSAPPGTAGLGTASSPLGLAQPFDPRRGGSPMLATANAHAAAVASHAEAASPVQDRPEAGAIAAARSRAVRPSTPRAPALDRAVPPLRGARPTSPSEVSATTHSPAADVAPARGRSRAPSDVAAVAAEPVPAAPPADAPPTASAPVTQLPGTSDASRSTASPPPAPAPAARALHTAVADAVDRIRPIPRGGVVLRVELAELGPVRIRLMPGAKAGPPTIEIDLRDALPNAGADERGQLLRGVASALRAAQSSASPAAGRWNLAVRTHDSLTLAPPVRADAGGGVTVARADDPPALADDAESPSAREPGALEAPASRTVASTASADAGTSSRGDDDAADPDGRRERPDPEREGSERSDDGAGHRSPAREGREGEPAGDDAAAASAASDLTARWRRTAAGHPSAQSRHGL